MPDKHSHMNHHVDPELIRRYLAGELDNKAMHALEKQAMDDPFLADALEGFSERKPDQRVHLTDLNRRLEMRVQGKEDRRGGMFTLNYRWLAAAGVLLVIGTGMLWLLQMRNAKDNAIVSQRANVSDSSITDTLQYYNREEPVAWGKATPERPLAVSIPADTGLLAAKDARRGALAAEASVAMMRRDDSVTAPLAVAPGLADSLEGRMAAVAAAPPNKVAEEMAGRNQVPAAAAPAPAPGPAITTRLIQGRVKTQDNAEGMAGVTVRIEGTDKGALTDNEGNFSIRVADTAKDLKLVVAAIGFDSKKLDVSRAENNLDITLNEQANALSDVVVTGYSKKGGYKSKQDNVYQLPTPVNGYEQYKEYLAKNVRYPASAAAANITGRVRVSVRVMPDGTLEDIKITRRLQPDCDAEALRVVKEGPEWKPASDGKATRIQIDVHFAPK